MIARPITDTSKVLSFDLYPKYVNRLNGIAEFMRANPTANLFFLSESGLHIARSEILFSRSTHIYTGLCYYIDLGYGHLRRELEQSIDLEISVVNRAIKIQSFHGLWNCNSYEWTHFINASILINNKDKLDQLLNFKIWEFIDLEEPFHKLFAQFQYYLLTRDMANQQKFSYLLHEDAESNIGVFIGREKNEKIYIAGRSERIKTLYLPLVNLYDLAAKENTEEFNEILNIYLLAKRSYLIKEKLADDFRYWIDFSCLAVCAFACDLGIDIIIESDYIPKWVYKREFEKELLF